MLEESLVRNFLPALLGEENLLWLLIVILDHTVKCARIGIPDHTTTSDK